MWEKLVLMVLPLVFHALTPALYDFFVDAVKHMEKNAAETSNPYDDVFVSMLKTLLNMQD